MANKYTFFYRTASPFSQFHSAKFEEDDIIFNCTEQYMMYGKAKLFKDYKIAKQILKKIKPMDMKKLGRRVRNFSEEVWKANREDIVYRGNYLKFTQNPHLKEALLETGNSILVEASPSDKIWGIGMTESNPKVHDPSNWKGQNLLGKILTNVRIEIREES